MIEKGVRVRDRNPEGDGGGEDRGGRNYAVRYHWEIGRPMLLGNRSSR